MSIHRDIVVDEFNRVGFRQRLNWIDSAWALLLLVAVIGIWDGYGAQMDGYEHAILVGTAMALGFLGWHWKPFCVYLVAVALLSLSAIYLYGSDLVAADRNFFLKYLLASQSAVMWMSALFVFATASYFFSLLSGSLFGLRVGAGLTWCAAAMGLVGLLVRWRESYLIHVDFGHIPVSNLYEVFILFCMITALLYLYYEQRSGVCHLGGFALLVISSAVGFILWYTFDRGAHEIQPLVPALQSYWMKIHVPANFIGYGAFALAAMAGVAYLLRARLERSGGRILQRLPTAEQLDNIMYRTISLGFAFFTVATVLGALWAAEAWGGYWSWDPKETWALIVWLNYAAWLHIRLARGMRGTPLAWWSIIGLFVTLFAFLGVNMFLSGLHSYGEL